MAGENLTVITGGSRGIGHFLVQSFLKDMSVLNISRQPARTSDRSSAHELHNLRLDLQNVEEIDGAINAWFRENGDYRVKYLIHNAAILNLGGLDQISSAEFHQSFRINVYAPLQITRSIFSLGRFCEAEPRIVYVTSSLGRPEPALSFAGMGLYSVTKAAVSRLALMLAREFEIKAPHIKILRIHPGIVDTEMQRELRRNLSLDPAFRKKTEGLPPYQEGEWDDKSPREHMRTISSNFAAEFISWVARLPRISADEYDFYTADEFHRARSKYQAGPPSLLSRRSS